MKKKNSKLWMMIAAAAILLIAVYLIIGPGRKKTVQAGNQLVNGDFSQTDSDGLPNGWYTDAYNRTPGYTDYSLEDGAATIVNHAPNDARFAQTVKVVPDSLYCLSGEIRAKAQDGLGANLSVEGIYVFSESVYDTKDEWQRTYLYGRTGKSQKEVTVFARLGGYSGEATGTASFRNISLEQVSEVPSTYYAYNWYQETQRTEDSAASGAAWPWLLLLACGYALLCWLLRQKALDGGAAHPQKNGWAAFALMLLLAAAVRVAIALIIPGYDVDIGCFTAWGTQMAQTGAANFYPSVSFCDYPPGYILVLGLLGSIGKALGTGLTEFMVKLPSILCDAGAAALLYTWGRKRVPQRAAFTVAALYAFNPLTIAAGAAWGQSDSVMLLLLLAVVILAIDDRWAAALPLYMAAVLVKPQALMFGPLGLIALVCSLIKKKNKKLYIQTAIGLALAAAVGLAIVLPFSPNMDNSEGWWIIRLYQNTMGYYDNVTVNACNLYFLFSLNWQDVAASSAWYVRLCAAVLMLGGLLALGIRNKWYKADIRRELALALCGAAVIALAAIPMTYSAFGTVVIILGVLLCGGPYLAGKSIRHLPLLGALLLILLCNLGVMMHERYLFPAVALLALACILERDWRVYLLFAAVSCAAFLNVSVVLDRGIRIGGSEGHLSAPVFGITSDSAFIEYAVSALNCLITFFSVRVAAGICLFGEQAAVRAVAAEKAGDSQKREEIYVAPALRELTQPASIQRMGWIDWALMLGVTAVYAVAALTNLGSTTSPQTWWRSAQTDEKVVLDLGENHAFNMLYLGGIHRYDQDFSVRVSEDGENWSEYHWAGIKEGQCFQWQYVPVSSFYDGARNYSQTPELLFGRYVEIEAQNIGTTIYEVILRDPETQTVYPVTLAQGKGENLIDEQDAFSGEPGWYNSTYFDEIYHARTGYEHYLAMQGDTTYMPYETSHPPLGKLLIAFSIGIFGMTPFGWRFAGAMAGILMLPGIYLLGRLLTKRRIMAFAAMFLLAVDFMHFTQTRIATIDSFVVLFIIWSYVFMVYYIRMDYWNTKLWKTLIPLFLSGLFMGFSVASKWTGCYAGVGLAVLFFWGLYRRYTQSLQARREKITGARATAAAKEIYLRPLVTLACCLVFFIAVPLTIYYVSYIPYFLPYSPPGVTVRRVTEAAVGDYFNGGAVGGMLGYHGTPGLGMDHPFYSPWYEWPIIKKPMWYYSSTYRSGDGTQTIVAFGNPLIWWGGLLALFCVALVWLIRHFDRNQGLRLHTRQNDMRPAILLISFAAQFVPWMLVPRGTYIYHYFPSVPFIILCTALCFDLLCDAAEHPITLPAWVSRGTARLNAFFGRIKPEEEEAAAERAITLRAKMLPVILAILCMAVALGLFIAFFPYISGAYASNSWLHAMQWFDGWIYY